MYLNPYVRNFDLNAAKKLIDHISCYTTSLTKKPLGLWCGGSYFSESRPPDRVPHDIDILVVGSKSPEEGINSIIEFTRLILDCMHKWEPFRQKHILMIPRYEVLVAAEAGLIDLHDKIFIHLMPFCSVKDLSEFHPPHITEQLIRDSVTLFEPAKSIIENIHNQRHERQEYPMAFLSQMLLETWVMLVSDFGKNSFGFEQSLQRYRYIVDWLGLDSFLTESHGADLEHLRRASEILLKGLAKLLNGNLPNLRGLSSGMIK